MKFSLKVIVYIFFGFEISSISVAQDHDYRFKNLTTDEGYNLNISGNVVQDKQGFIWFPAFDGLYRYDGYGFKKFEHRDSDPHSLSFNTIYSLYADADGSLWVGTFGGGLNHLDPATGKFSVYRYDAADSSSISSDRASLVFRDSKKRLWIATPGPNGLCIFNDSSKTFRRITIGNSDDPEKEKNKKNNVYGIAEAADGDLFIANWDGLYILSDQTNLFTAYRCDTGEFCDRNNTMGPVCLDEDGILWIGTWGAGLKSFDKKTGIFQTYLWNKIAGISRTNNIVKGIEMKSKDELWVARLDHTGFGPLAVFDKKKKEFSFIDHSPGDPQSIADGQGAGLFKDKSGHLWISIGNKGVSRLDLNKKSLSHIQIEMKTYSDLPSPTVVSCWKDTARNLAYAGTSWSDGLYIIDLKTGCTMRAKGQESKKGITEWVTYADKDSVYIAGDRLKILDPVSQTISLFIPQPPSQVSNVGTDLQGNLWCISENKVLHFDKRLKSWDILQVPAVKDEPAFMLHDIALHSDGTIWTGSDEHGIFIIDPVTRHIRNIRKSTGEGGLPFNTVICFKSDKQGKMWCGGIGGIAIYEPDGKTDRFTRISAEHGLLNDFVNHLKCDSEGFIWASTLKGLSKINPADRSISNYEINSGLFKKQQITSFDIADDGQIITGTIGGLTHFFPDQLKKKTTEPQLAISSFRIFDKEHPLPLPGQPEPLKLEHHQNYFSFEFAALTFSDADENRYAYKLEGFDKDWIQAGNRRYAAYTNLPGGEYIFKLKAANKEGVWNSKPLTIPLFIGTPWWKTSWFYALIAAVICGSAYLFYLYRIRQLKAIFAIRNRLAADLHDEVGSSLSNIRLLSEMLQTSGNTPGKKATENLIAEQIRENARDTLEGMYDIIWNLNPSNDHLGFLLGRLKEQTLPLTENRNIELTWDITNLDKSVKLSLEKRKDLYLSCKEAIQNVLKYSECSDLELHAHTSGNSIQITISDNGKGFSGNPSHGGNGLVNMRQRMERWKGRCVIASSVNGTTVNLSLPI